MLFDYHQKLTMVLLFFCSAAFSQITLPAIPDSLHQKLVNEDSTISLKEAAEIRRSFRPDTVKTEEDFLIMPKDSLYGTHVNPLIVTTEVLGLNAFVWGWDYFVLDKTYAHTGPSYWKRNFREGWKWDHNHWAINFYGHPYQGSMYYSAARAGGYGFYGSMIYAALGSSTWEMFCETEYPAPNDLISTTISGSMYGEVLYRLSRAAYNRPGAPWYRQVAAFVFQPAAYVQRKAFGNRDFYTGWVPIELTIATGMGSRFGSDYRIGGENADELDEEWNDRHGMMALSLEYGKPYTKVRKPFDYFKIDMFGEGGLEGNVLQMDIMGKLLNGGIHGRGHWLDFSVNLDYDTFYGDLATVSTLSLGGAMDIALRLTPSTRFRVMNQIYWIMLGSADMGYDDIIQEFHPDYKSDKDNYQYNSGIKYSLLVEFMYKKKWRFYDKVTLDAMRTIDGSTPNYGVSGWDLLLLNSTALEYRILPWMDLGNRLDTYVKMAAYSSEMAEPMSRSIFTFSLYLNFHLLGD